MWSALCIASVRSAPLSPATAHTSGSLDLYTGQQMPYWLSAVIDRPFPETLAISGTPEFRDYAIEFTTPQFRISLWLALFTLAIFGIWDVFGQDGGVMTTRFRFLGVVDVLPSRWIGFSV
jgi:hypothetical protein